eukprot:CAMPEP_0116889512 /NCGR_PEP_ID=MMETSP0467-20121206/41_1 /TAXON_ID=283647 /ORGANISM="Mesodinium pulex, Strain SPMC105" /LENGTH=138 /DNA_ID=CAMNT_0004556327 /DNA_START=197 /DNA_END=612 /DNA_ORIENTATION=-
MKEGGVDDALAHFDVALLDEHAGVVDAGCDVVFEDHGLQSAFEQLLGGQTQHVVEFVLFLAEQPLAVQASQQGVGLEDALLVVLGLAQQRTCGLTQLGEGEQHAPDFTFVLESVLADHLHLAVHALLLETPLRALGHS